MSNYDNFPNIAREMHNRPDQLVDDEVGLTVTGLVAIEDAAEGIYSRVESYLNGEREHFQTMLQISEPRDAAIAQIINEKLVMSHPNQDTIRLLEIHEPFLDTVQKTSVEISTITGADGRLLVCELLSVESHGAYTPSTLFMYSRDSSMEHLRKDKFKRLAEGAVKSVVQV